MHVVGVAEGNLQRLASPECLVYRQEYREQLRDKENGPAMLECERRKEEDENAEPDYVA